MIAICLPLAAGLAALRAQPDQEGAVLQPGVMYHVNQVTIKFVGTANVNEEVVRSNMQTHAGGEFDDAMLDRDIRNLYKTGLFEYIEIQREAVGPNTFDLVVDVTPKYRVLAVRFVGNKKLKTARLRKEIKTRPDTALDERQVKEDAEALQTFYQKEGYNQATVTYTVDRDRSTGFGTVTYHIFEGNKVRIEDIRFAGNHHIKARELRRQMDTKRWWMFSWLTGNGRFKEDQFEDDLDKLRTYYREDGYLDVSIPEDGVSIAYPKPGRMIITIRIDEGRQYRIGSISFSGNRLHSSALLRRLVKEKSGMVFSPSKIDSDAQLIQDFYGRDGYLDTQVNVIRRPNIATGNIDVEYQIQESDRYNVESIDIDGNTKTKSTVILRELVLGPGDVFDTTLMKISKNRLENTRFFDNVDITPQDTNIPGRKNMHVVVKEGRTGNLTFGAGYSSLERASVFAEISQSNFDLFNPHSLFQGAGEKFRIRLELGELATQAVISFEQPWLFEKELDLGFSLFRTSSQYESSYYTEVDLGATVSLRKHLFELVQAQLAYTYEIVEIRNVDPSASPIILASAGNNAESRVDLSLIRDTRDKIISPTSGNRIEVDFSVAGGPLGGDNNYYKFGFDGDQNFEIFKTQEQVLSLIARGGTAVTFGSTHLMPYYDAYYLGGPDDLRGFEYRQVSPRDEFGEPIGGKSSALFTAEYSLDIVSPVRFAIFYDVGYVNKGSFDFNPSDYQDDIGVGIRLFVMGAPLSLDYAMPMRGDQFYPNKQGNQFNFSFGSRF